MTRPGLVAATQYGPDKLSIIAQDRWSTYSYLLSYLSQDGNIIRSDDISLDWMECPFILENI